MYKETKSLEELKVGDLLRRKSDNELYRLNHIMPKDNYDDQSNYGFFGFYVKEKVMRKFFHNEGKKMMIF